MKLHIVEKGQLVKYERVGECNKCGHCCCTKQITCQTQASGDSGEDDDRAEAANLAESEGWSVFWAQGLWWWMKAEVLDSVRKTPCTAFENGLCTIWQADEWPAICRYWPVHPNDLHAFPECGFRFVRKGGNENGKAN